MPCLLNPGDTGFPDTATADEDGLLAVGGDLSVPRLLSAYGRGIFPWYSDGYPILWWTPDPRFVLFPEKLHVSSSMKRVLKKKEFTITFDTVFEKVIDECRRAERREKGTWITDAIVDGYTALHREGYCHSIEAWKDGELSGGLYGVSLGSVFFGESMFAKTRNASKAAFIELAAKLKEWNFSLIDCQVHTAHLESLGAEMIGRTEFEARLAEGLKAGTRRGSWGEKR